MNPDIRAALERIMVKTEHHESCPTAEDFTRRCVCMMELNALVHAVERVIAVSRALGESGCDKEMTLYYAMQSLATDYTVQALAPRSEP